tara:strand:+ start:395 stop:520 length:126 start_codon:yes stop_codon:yes gene_type:complete
MHFFFGLGMVAGFTSEIVVGSAGVAVGFTDGLVDSMLELQQ